MPDSEISNNRLRLSLGRSRLLSWLALILAVAGVFSVWYGMPAKPKPLAWIPESTGPGIIRYYGQGLNFQVGNEYQRADIVLFESNNGSMKILQPICQSQLSIHPHMRVNIDFHWAPYRSWRSGRGPANGEECYSVDNVQSLGADAQ